MQDNHLLLIGLLDIMERAVSEKNREVFFNKFYQLRNIKTESVSDPLVIAYKRLLDKAIIQFKQDETFNTIVSSIISLSYGLIPTDRLDDDLLKILTECLDLKDNRIKANALTAISEFDPNSELFKEHINSRFNRIAAEALVAEGKKGLSLKIFEKLKEFFNSSNPFFVASGVYAVGQLLEFYNESFVKTDNIFKSDFDYFIKKINTFCIHPHEMVRKRALMTKSLIDNQFTKKPA